MPALDASTLANLASCFNSCIPPGAQLSVTNYLLAQLAKASNPELDVTPSALANAARCFDTCIPPGMQLAVANYLLSQLTGGVSPGGGLVFSTGAGDPEGVVTGSPGDTYWDSNENFYYVKVTGTGTTTGWQIH